MKPAGPLPELLPQQVSVYVTRQIPTYDAHGQLVTPPNTAVEMPLYEAVREARYSLLLGDLGSGKSTLAGSLVLETLALSTQTVAVLVPAKELQLTAPLSPAAVLNAIARFVREYIDLSATDAMFSELLKTAEVLIVLDGLDEIDQTLASQLLRHTPQLTKAHTGLQVLASARPVELAGISLNEDGWKFIRTVALQDSQRIAILQNELLANGVAPEVAVPQAIQLFGELQAMPALSAVATTPLFMRLLYPKLLEFSQTGQRNALTLGDLLFEVIIERLGRWGQRDEKVPGLTASLFEQHYPKAEHKAELLGQLARRSLQTATIQVAAAPALLLGYLPADVTRQADKLQLAREAVDYLRGCGLATGDSLLEFAAQPLTEMLAAVAMASEWAATGATNPLPAITEWRVVAFAVALARQWHLHEQVRPLLTTYYHTLLTASPGYLAAAALIATEFQDVASAQAVLDTLDGLHRVQLVYNYQGDERDTEAQAIAQLLLLAGQRGVTWFYTNYLNPRAPLSQMGLALVEEVLRQWVHLLLLNTGDVDISSLAELVAPYRAFGNMLPLHMLSYLVLLFPESFPVEERIHLLCQHLSGKVLLQEYAAIKLREIASAGERAAVQAALLSHANEYSRISLRVVALWLELNDSAAPLLPPMVVEAAFEAVSVSSEEVDWHLARDVQALLGEQAWLQHARWGLSAEQSATAAGAAMALYQAGQQDFWLLCDALLRGLDDFHPHKATEQLLGELIAREGTAGYQWLADRLSTPKPRQGTWKRGLDASQWRLLLPVIASLEKGPQLLGETLLNLGIYTLPRHPEVREQFMQLLNGPRGDDFLRVLGEQLTHPNPELRWGAAAVLLVFDPIHQSEALLAIVRAHLWVDDTAGDWLSFCLSLSIGAGPLQQLQEALPNLPAQVRVFTLVILYIHQVLPALELQEEMFRALLHHSNWRLNYRAPGQSILATPTAKLMLLTVLEEDDVTLAEQAASQLRIYHLATLTVAQQATCLVRYVKASNLHYLEEDLVARLRSNAPFAEAVMTASAQLESRELPRPFLFLLASAIANPAEWPEVVWAFVHQPDRFHSIEDEDLMILYIIGQRYPEYRQSIGEAALALSVDADRWQTNRRPKAVQWLILLADEFLGGQPSGVLQDALQLSFEEQRWSSYNSVAARALLARLPEIPASLFNPPAPWQTPARGKRVGSPIMDLPNCLLDLARDTSAISSTVVNAIHEALSFPPFTQDYLAQLGQAGMTGGAIALTLRFCYQQPARLTEAIGIFDGRLQELPQDHDKAIKQRLRMCWQLARHETLSQPGHEQAVEEYIQALDQAFAQDAVPFAPLVVELLNTRGSLLPNQVRVLPQCFAHSHASWQSLLLRRVCDWLAQSATVGLRPELLPAIQDVVNTLDQLPANKTDKMGPAVHFLFSFAYWAFAEEQLPAAQNIFLQGLKQVYSQTGSSHSTNLTELLTSAESLFLLVPPIAVADALVNGKNSHDPAIRQLSRFLTYLTARTGLSV